MNKNPDFVGGFAKAATKAGYVGLKQEAPAPEARTFVEVELEDGTVARWFIPEKRLNDILDCLTARLGEPETIRL